MVPQSERQVMIRSSVLSARVGMLLMLSIALVACQELSSIDVSSLLDSIGQNDTETTEETDGEDTTNDLDGILPSDCGTRTVIYAPAEGTFLKQQIVDFTMDVSPANSALGKALFGENPEAATGFDFADSGFLTLYEIGALGAVVNTYYLSDFGGEKTYGSYTSESSMTFVVKNGCLNVEGDAADEPTDLTTSDVIESSAGLCGDAAISLGRDGLLVDDNEGEEYICIQVAYSTSCVDCWFADNAWHMKIVVEATYTALGSLDNVQVALSTTELDQTQKKSSTAETTTVNIVEGDSVTLTQTSEVSYEVSSSPEELGYEQITTLMKVRTN
jgi:hypothetical protein